MLLSTKLQMAKILLAAEPAAPNSTQSMFMSVLPLILLFVVMYFLLIRPQKKKQKEVEQMRSELIPGNRIVTIGGFIGKVKKVTENEIYVVFSENSDHVVLRKWSVQSVLDKEEAKEIEKNSKKTLGMAVPEMPEEKVEDFSEELAEIEAEVKAAEVKEVEIEEIKEEPADEWKKGTE